MNTSRNFLKLTDAGLFFLAAGIFTSVTILSVYQILFTVPLIWFSVLALKNQEINFPKSTWWLLGFTAVALISLCLNFDLIPKPSKNFGRLKYFLYGAGGIFVFREWLNLASDKVKKILISVFFVSIIVAGSYAVMNYLQTGTRAKGLTDTMRYGYGSAMALLLIFSALLHHDKFEKLFDKRLGWAAFIIGLVGMYVTYTRGALLGFLCGLPFTLYYYRPKLGKIVAVLSLLIIMILSGFYIFGTGTHSSRFLTNKSNSSDVIRRSQWQAAIIAIKERPILGWGLSNFHSQLKRIKEEHNLGAQKYNDAHSHNLFLEVASGTGLIGLFLFLGWLLNWAREIFKKKGITRALVIPFGVAFVVSSQFEVTFDANNASMIFFLYALSSVVDEHVKPI